MSTKRCMMALQIKSNKKRFIWLYDQAVVCLREKFEVQQDPTNTQDNKKVYYGRL